MTVLMLRRGAGDPERVELSVTILRPSSADEVAAAVAAYATDGRGQVYVERAGHEYRWSPAHRGGPAPLMHLVARLLACETSDLTVGYTTVDGWCIVRDPEEAPADQAVLVDADAVINAQALMALVGA